MRRYIGPLAQLLVLVHLSCGIKGQDFDQMVDGIISKSIPLIQTAELAEEMKRKDDLIILDAREKDEYHISHIQRSIWVGYDDFDPSALELDPEKDIVVYCSVGYRSEKVAEQLRDEGYKNVRNLYGGIFRWVNEGRSVVDNGNKGTQKVHPYNEDWGRWLTKGVKSYE